MAETTAFNPGDVAAADHFRTHGWVLVDTLDEAGVADLRSWVDEVASWPDADGDWQVAFDSAEPAPASAGVFSSGATLAVRDHAVVVLRRS